MATKGKEREQKDYGDKTQSRKWQFTINNPIEKGYTHEKIKQQLALYTGMVYWCMCDEIGDNGTYHTHIYMQTSTGTRFTTAKKRFPGAHIEFVGKGTALENRNYIRKEGEKWADSSKEHTNLRETFEEYGELPVERPGKRNDLCDLYDMIKSGMTDYEILETNPEYLFNMDKVDRARQIIREDKYKDEFRQLEITYIYGKTGTGKTRSVMEKYGYSNVYRVTDYDHPFDGYQGQDVIIFEEFRSSLKIQDMLNYLDGYPLTLPCRYNNKVACFTKVFIITNETLGSQYKEIQEKHPETWEAFLRRIDWVKEYSVNGVTEFRMKDYQQITMNWQKWQIESIS